MLIDRRRLLTVSLLSAGAAACAASVKQAGRTSATAPSPPTSVATRHRRESHPSGPAREIYHGRRTASTVALTFHTAGDPAVVERILRHAESAGVGLTMLVVGTWLQQHPAFARRILAGGHDLGNHTWSHPVLSDDDAAHTHDEITRCRDLLHHLTGTPGSWFRPSGTPHADPLILSEAGRAGYPASLAYDVDPLDYTDPGAAAVVARVLAAARGGSVVSMHTLFKGTADAMPDILTGLSHRGLRPVTASRLLGRRWAA